MHALKKNRPLRRIVLASAATVCGTVLLLSLKPHSTPAVAVAVPAPSGSASAGASTGTRTVTGDTVQTRWGPVQVRITLKNGKLTEVTAVAYPTDNPRDQEINSFALPGCAARPSRPRARPSTPSREPRTQVTVTASHSSPHWTRRAAERTGGAARISGPRDHADPLAPAPEEQ